MAQNLIGGLLDLAGKHLDREDRQEFAREMMLKESDIQMADKKELADYASKMEKDNANYKLGLEKQLLQYKSDLETEFNKENDIREKAMYAYKKEYDTNMARILMEERAELENKALMNEEVRSQMKSAMETTPFVAYEEKETRSNILPFLNPLSDSGMTDEIQGYLKNLQPYFANLKRLPQSDPRKQDAISNLLRMYNKANTEAYMGDDIFSDDGTEKQNVEVLRSILMQLGKTPPEVVEETKKDAVSRFIEDDFDQFGY